MSLTRALSVSLTWAVKTLLQNRPASGYELVSTVAKMRPEQCIETLRRHDPIFRERKVAYSQEGEDLVLTRLLAGRPAGRFVDIGAHHPYRFSNTYLLYLSGWRGINVDANPESMQAFEAARPEDTNIECFVGSESQEVEFFQYDEPALNTASADLVERRKSQGIPYTVVNKIAVRTRTLKDILDQYHPEGQAIDVMNLDVEGHEMSVLKSNDWTKYRPEIILLEAAAEDVRTCLSHPSTMFLTERGYVPIAKAYNTVIFRTEG